MTGTTQSSIDLHPAATEIDHDVVPGSTEWLWYMTGSKVASVLGISPFTTRLELWRQMTGKAGPTHVTDHMQWGTDREPIIREGTAAAKGCVIHTPRMLVSNANPRHAYSPDGLIEPASWEPTGLWEAKTATGKSAATWAFGIPPHYEVQWQWGAYVTGMDRGLFTLETHVDFVPVSTADYPITRNDERISELIVAVDEFLGYVDADVEPPPLGAVVVSDPEDIDTIRRWNKSNAQRLDFEKEIKALRAIIDPMGENASALMTPEGEVLCHWSETVKESESVDWAAIYAENPEAVERAVVTSVDRKRLIELVPGAVRTHTTTDTTTIRRLLMGAAK